MKEFLYPFNFSSKQQTNVANMGKNISLRCTLVLSAKN